MPDLKNFRIDATRFEHVLTTHSSASKRRLSTDIDCKPNYLANLTRDLRNGSMPKGPWLYPMVRLAGKLGITVDHLVGAPKLQQEVEALPHMPAPMIQRLADSEMDTHIPIGHAPSEHALRYRWYRTGGRIEAFEDVMQYLDYYHAPIPTDENIRVLHVGPKSMAGITMGECDPATLENALNNSPIRLKVMDEHRECLRRGPFSTIETLNSPMPNRPINVTLTYSAYRMPLSNCSNEKFVAVYAVPLGF